jgi:hypothetical protein
VQSKDVSNDDQIITIFVIQRKVSVSRAFSHSNSFQTGGSAVMRQTLGGFSTNATGRP